MTVRKVSRRKGMFESFLLANPIKSIGATIASLAVIFSAGLYVDERYAHAGDMRQLSGQLEVNRLTAEVSVLEIRRSSLEDKVYDAAARSAQQKKFNASDQVITNRYQTELRDVIRQISEKRQLIDQLRAGKK